MFFVFYFFILFFLTILLPNFTEKNHKLTRKMQSTHVLTLFSNKTFPCEKKFWLEGKHRPPLKT
jgi:hypothetical protein